MTKWILILEPILLNFGIFIYPNLFCLLFRYILAQSCERNNPIFKDNKCNSIFCTKNEFNSSICSIENEIIKTQWLNNFISLEISYLRYVSFASFSNGDMILQIGTFPNSYFRIFIGFQKNGRCLFKNHSAYHYLFHAEQDIDIYEKYESENIVIRPSGNKNNKSKEYLMSVSKMNSFVEIYDFENDKIYQKILYDFSKMKYIDSYQNMAIPLFSNTSDYYYLFGFIGNNSDFHEQKFIIQKHIFNSIENFHEKETLNKSIIFDKEAVHYLKTGFSCFQTKKQFIICFFLTSSKEYIIVVFDSDLNEKSKITLPSTELFFRETFYKCVHLKDEIGIFAYYKYYLSDNPQYFPILVFKEYKENNLVNYNFPDIILNKYKMLYDPYMILNDFIKLNDKKFCFCSTNNGNKNNLYIILINLFDEQKYKIRYYRIDLFNLYGYIVYMQLKAFNFNNFISLAFSYHNPYVSNCNNDDINKSCVTLLIFSYPNSTDDSLFLDEYLKRDLSLNNISINLENGVRIENNIFGHVFSGIIIKDLKNCENLKIKSTLYNDGIQSGYNLTKNEVMKLEFSGFGFNSFICNMQYSYKVTEPNLSEYDIYPIDIDGTREENSSNFEKEEYIGRLSYYNIILKEDLIIKCNISNCRLCVKNEPDLCMEYKYKEINKYLDIIIENGDIEITKRALKANKEQLQEELPVIMDKIETGKNYEITGDDFNIIIKPTNISIKSGIDINFSSCEVILRRHYNISDSRIITFLQLEINNNNSQYLMNQVEYQAYDDHKNILDLSLCNDTNIKLFYLIKSNSSIDISLISSFKDNNIDIFNIKDNFFNDKCTSYSYNGNDVILKDRISDFYLNYSLCEEGCTYNVTNLELLKITCDCKVKINMTTNLTDKSFVQQNDIKKDSSFEIIKCYKLFFSWENKLFNIGFWIFSIFILCYILLLILFFLKGIKSIKEFLEKEILKNGYTESNDRKTTESINIGKRINKNRNGKEQKNKKNLNSPPKLKNNITKKGYMHYDKNLNDDDSSINRIKQQDKKVILINNIINENQEGKKKYSKKYLKKRTKTTKKNNIILKNDKENKFSNSPKNIICQNINNLSGKNQDKVLNESDANNLNIINRNLNKPKLYLLKSSNYILNIYTLEEARKCDYRPFCKIFYIYLIVKQPIIHAFLYRSPLIHFSLRFCLLIILISSDLALNAIFYLDYKISEKYKSKKSLFLLAFTNNITMILLSSLIGYTFLILYTKINIYTNDIKEVFSKEDKEIIRNKKYISKGEKKLEARQKIENLLKKFKIKVTIYTIIELLLMIIFWYYVTVFCQIYSCTQNSWLLDSFLSILSQIIIDFLFSFIFAIFYRIGIKANIKCLYRISLFFYNYS